MLEVVRGLPMMNITTKVRETGMKKRNFVLMFASWVWGWGFLAAAPAS
jgi:hypothetical protein